MGGISAPETDTEVLVVGAGPVGLAMAIELAYRGIRCIVLERDTGDEDQFPKISLVSMRSMEIFRRWGLVDQIRNNGFPNDYELSIVFATAVGKWILSKDFFPTTNDMETPAFTPERKQQCPQHLMMGILRRTCAERDTIEIRYRREVRDLIETEDRVTAVAVNGNGKEERISARYVVACDGANSGVREMLGFRFEGIERLGYSLSVLFNCPDLLAKVGAPQALRYILVDQNGTWGNVQAIDGKDKWRLMVTGGKKHFDLETFDAAAAVRKSIGVPDVEFSVTSILPWRRSQLLASGYRQGRVFLAGDSAHTMSPTGGMGVNTGLADVADLGWKLQGALRGWGGEALLESYAIERRPVAKRTQEIATYNFRNWMDAGETSRILDEGPEGDATRHRVGERMRKNLSDDWRSWGVQLGYRYVDSPVLIDDGREQPPDTIEDYAPSAKPGHRAPHVWLSPGRSVLDLFGPGFALLYTDPAAGDEARRLGDVAAKRGVPFSSHLLDRDDVRALYGAKLVLVRPDGHVAWRSDAMDSAEQIIRTVTGNAAVR